MEMNCLNYQQYYHKKEGFTLIELVSALAITAVLCICIAAIFMSAFNMEMVIERDSEMFSESYFLMEYIGNEIRKSEKVISTSKFILPTGKGEYLPFVLYLQEKNTKQIVAYAIHNNQCYRYSYRSKGKEIPYKILKWDISDSNLIAEHVRLAENCNFNSSGKVIHLSFQLKDLEIIETDYYIHGE